MVPVDDAAMAAKRAEIMRKVSNPLRISANLLLPRPSQQTSHSTAHLRLAAYPLSQAADPLHLSTALIVHSPGAHTS